MSNFTKGKWVLCDGQKIYACPDDDGAVLIADLHGDNVSEKYANGILIANAPKMYKALNEICKNMPILVGASELDEFLEAMHRARRLLSRIKVESHVET